MPNLPDAPIWVMEDHESGARRAVAPSGARPGPPASALFATPATAIAGRLGLPFRRIGAAGPANQVAAGSLPAMVLCSGRQGAARAMLHKARHGGVVVHCLRRAAIVPPRWLAAPFDLLVAPRAGRGGERDSPRVLHSLGPAQPVSPALLSRARLLWRDRLDYLPWPRLALVLGGGAPDPSVIVSLARRLTALMRSRDGCILAAALSDCPPHAADALSEGLAGGAHLLHRAGEPGPDPMLAFLGAADAIVMGWTGPVALAEACAADGPVFVTPGLPQGARGFARQLLERDQLRVWPEHGSADPFAAWARAPLDESGRIAALICGRYETLWNRSLEPDLPEQA